MSELEIKKSFDIHIAGILFGFLLHYKDELNLNLNQIDEFKNEFKNDAAQAIVIIFKLVENAGSKIYIVIDEYDSLTNALAIRYRYTNSDDNMYLRILGRDGFFRNFFQMLKNYTQNVIHQIYITGILPITISDMKSGFNIANWIHFNPQFANMLGITKSEFDNLIEEVYTDYPEITLDKQEVKDIIKKYYNGYKLIRSSEEVYNPMMTLYFLNNIIQNNQYPDILADFNIRISYDQIAFLFGQNLEKAKKIITEITETKEYELYTQLQITFDMKDFKEGTYIAEGLFYSGILTFSNELNILKIPNLITYGFALEYFTELQNFKFQNIDFSKWISAYKRRSDVKTLIDGFFRDIIQKFPGQFFANANESFYHGLLFQVLYNHTEKDIYEVIPEYNLPQGRADIMLKTYPNLMAPIQIHDLFEIKQVPKSATDTELETQLEKAKQQLINYKTGDYADFRGIAICFRGNLDYKIEIL